MGKPTRILSYAAKSLTFDTDFDTSLFDPNSLSSLGAYSSNGSTDSSTSSVAADKSGDTFNITLQALGELSDMQLMEMARKLVVFIKELKDRDDSPRGGVFA